MVDLGESEREFQMEIQWAEVLPPLSVIVPLLLMWWRLDNKIESSTKELNGKIEGVRLSLDGKIEDTSKELNGKIEDVRLSLDGKIEDTSRELNGKIEGVRLASETAHQSIRDDLCDLKVTTATIKTDVEWLKNDRQQ